jgi:hypothetical protein
MPVSGKGCRHRRIAEHVAGGDLKLEPDASCARGDKTALKTLLRIVVDGPEIKTALTEAQCPWFQQRRDIPALPYGIQIDGVCRTNEIINGSREKIVHEVSGVVVKMVVDAPHRGVGRCAFLAPRNPEFIDRAQPHEPFELHGFKFDSEPAEELREAVMMDVHPETCRNTRDRQHGPGSPLPNFRLPQTAALADFFGSQVL